MLLQTNSYIVPKDRRAEHARLMRRFRQVLAKLGCDNFEVYEQVGANWSGGETNGRFVQIMRFRDRKHQLSIQNAERSDPAAQALINEFCELVNFSYQQQQGFFAVGFYNSVLPVAPSRSRISEDESEAQVPVPVGEAEVPEAEEAAAVGEPDGIEQDQAETELPPPEHEAPAAGEHESESAAVHEAATAMPHDAMDFGHGEPAIAKTQLAEHHRPLHPDEIVAAEPPLDLEGQSATSGENIADVPAEQPTEQPAQEPVTTEPPLEWQGPSATSGENVAEVPAEPPIHEIDAAQPLSEEQLLAEVSNGPATGEPAETTEIAEPTDAPTLEADAAPEPPANGEQNGESVESPPPEKMRRRLSLFRRAPRNRG